MPRKQTLKQKKKAGAALQAQYSERKLKAGWRRVCTWCPPDQIEPFKKSVVRIQKQWPAEHRP